ADSSAYLRDIRAEPQVWSDRSRLFVHAILRDLVELRVGSFLLFERLRELLVVLGEAEHFGEGCGGAIAGDLVMLDALRGGDDGRIAYVGLLGFLDDILAFGDQAAHRFTDYASHSLIVPLQDFLDSVALPHRLLQMLFERLLELRMLRFLSHLRERLDELIFSVIKVSELVYVQVLQVLHSGVPPLLC